MKAVAAAIALKIAMSLALAYAVGTATAEFIDWSFTSTAMEIEQAGERK